MPDAFVTVHRSHDPVEAEIVGDLLVEDGLDARVLGGTSLYAEARVDVPAADEARARRVIASHLGEIRPSVEDEEPEAEDARRPLRPIVAAGVMAVCPGGAHFYARRPLLGAAILAGQVTMMGLAATTGPKVASAAALFACGLFLYDLVGGQVAVRAWNRGHRPARARQLVHGAMLFLGLGIVAVACAPVLERVHFPQRKGGGGGPRSPYQEIRARAGDPRDLPFPLHLDFNR